MMKNTDIFKQGSVWLARIYFKEINKSKLRPVVIVNNEIVLDIDVIVAPTTSRKDRNKFDVVLENWRAAGLERPSVARTTKITTISREMLIKRLGDLNESDLNKVLKKCRELF
ncbi:type II toxin-antitoxin system PemK/MazF family toxin [Lentibacillus salinarum]|uniref:Type II toxin-antitoxin system PemK/MazF family toxin n=1 Tax=Lentibacillus salinarum TaxID=446820 RepID=A0ABW3ZWH5_9BACI